MRTLATTLGTAAILMLAATASADTIAFNTNATPDSTPAATGLVGFEFTVNQNINLTQLGFYANSIGGGDTPHVALLDITAGQSNPPVVLFDTGNLVPGGLTNGIINYVSVGTPILLTPGNTYEVDAPVYFSEQFNSTSGFTYGSAIASETFLKGGGWAGATIGWDPTNGVPTEIYDYTAQSSSSPGAYISADFQYTTTSVPEPASIGFLALAGLALVGRRRRA